MGFFFLPVDSPVVHKQAKKNHNTMSKAHNKQTAGRNKVYFSSNLFLATVILDTASVVPTQLQKKTW